jgi:hypothetical protein
MQTELEIRKARSIVVRNMIRPDMSTEQKILLQGMSVALCWACNDVNGSTLQDIIDGRPIIGG